MRTGTAGTQFVLWVGTGSDEAILKAAGTALDTDLDARLEKEFALRSAFWTSLQGVGGDFVG